MLTPRGWWFLVLVLALLLVALWSGTPSMALVCLTLLFWFVGTWGTFAVRVRLLHGHLNVFRDVSDERGPVQSLWAGRTFHVHVRLHSSSGLPSPYLYVSDRVPYGGHCLSGQTHADGMVAVEGPLDIAYHLYCPAPGRLRFEGLTVQLADLQGFFYHTLFVQDVRQYRVLPALADAGGHIPTVKRHNLLPLAGAHRHRRPGSGSELLDLRDYLPGDPPKTIAWKASARRDRLMTKEFESEVPVRCTFFVDTSQSVRVGTPGQNALARLVEVTAAVAQAAAGARDLTGLCLFDERTTQYTRPARGARHLVRLIHFLADAAALPPTTAEVPVGSLLPLAYAFAEEVYPQLLRNDVNSFPWWLPWLTPKPAFLWRTPPVLSFRQALAARFSTRERRLFRWRKQLAALLSVRYGLGPGGVGLLLEDDAHCVLYLQRFLGEHHVPCILPFYDPQGRYLFAVPEKVEVLAAALLRAVGKGHDNELFVLLADLLEIGDSLGPLLRAVKVALARHHRVLVVCPWPPGLPLPPLDRETDRAGSSASLEAVVEQATVLRFHRAYRQLRRTFGRLGVAVLCARSEDSVQLILDRLERLRLQERGVR